MAGKSPKNQTDPEPFDFEQSLQELEALVSHMEDGDLSLEESLQQFERGIALARRCQQALQTAEQKVQILLNEGNEQKLADFDTGTENHPDNNDNNS